MATSSNPSPDNTNRSLFLVHLMKTGGTSVRELLWRHYDQSQVFPNKETIARYGRYPDLHEVLATHQEALDTAQLVAGHYPYALIDRFPVRPITAVVLRDPIERSLSYLMHAQRHRPEFSDSTLEEVLDSDAVRDGLITDYQTKVMSFANVFERRSVNHRMRLKQWRLGLAMENLERCDVVGVTSDISSFVQQLAKLLPFEVDWTEVPRVNVSPPSGPIGDHLLERIAELVAKDTVLYARAVEMSADV